MTTYSYLFKYIVIGDTSVGKSCLVLRFINDRVRQSHDITIGVEFGAKIVEHDNTNIKLQIWDTAGQENFRSITRSYYRSAGGALLVYDITSRSSFDNLYNWIQEVRDNGNPSMVIILVGNKTDREQDRKVTYQEGYEFAQKHGMLFQETSAINGQKVEDAFMQTTIQIYQNILDKKIDLRSEVLFTFINHLK